MAIYPYRCQNCRSGQEVVQSISSYSAAPIRPLCCGVLMTREITLPMVQADFAPFVSPIDGSVINGRAGRREHMLRHDVVPTDDIMPDVIRNKKAMQESFRAGLRETVAESIMAVEQGYKPPILNEAQLIPGA